jgi:taurine transport system permease protein
MRQRHLGVLAVLIALVLWSGLTALLHPTRFPSPQEVFQAAHRLATKGYVGGTLLTHTLHSLKLALLGFIVAISGAVPLGLAMGYDRRFDAVVSPLVSIIRPIPPLAWIPLAIIWFGLGDSSKVFMIWFTAFLPALINTYAGVRSIDPTLVSAARV